MKKFLVPLVIVCAVAWPVRAELYSQTPPMTSPTSSSVWSNSGVVITPFFTLSNVISADSFTLSQDATITGLEWYGVYPFGIASPSSAFGVSFFSDAGGLPGAEIAQFTVSASVSDAGLGSWIYKYTANGFSPVDVAAGETIWLSIYEDDSTTTSQAWGWNVYSNTAGHYVQSSGSSGWSSYTGDLAFALEGRVVPVPGAVLLGALGLSFAGWRLRRKTM
jgi:hypothetical protein